MFLRRLITATLCLCLTSVAAAKERVWTDSTGRTVRGEFVAERDGEVTLLVRGKLVTLTVNRLSEKDQQVVRDLAAGKEIPDDPLDGFGSGEPLDLPVGDSKVAEEGNAPAEPAAEAGRAEGAVPPGEKLPSLTKKLPALVNRTWTDTSGQQFTGKFVRMFDGKVVLSRISRHVTVGFYELSAADQDYLRELLRARGEEGLIPPAPAALGGNVAMPAATKPAAAAGPAAPAIDYGSSTPPGAIEYGPGTAIPPAEPASTGTAPAGTLSDPPMYGPSGYGTGSSPTSTMPASTYTPPTYSPGIPAPNYPSDANRKVGICSGCRRSVTQEQSQGTHCPHCGTKWMFNSVTNQTASSSDDQNSDSGLRIPSLDTEVSEQAVRSGVIIVVSVIAITVLVGGVIALALAIASASRGGKQYKEYR